MAEVKFNVYKLEYEFDKSLFKPCNLKECLDNLDLKKHLYKINEHKGFLDKKAENIFSFQKFRKYELFHIPQFCIKISGV